MEQQVTADAGRLVACFNRGGGSSTEVRRPRRTTSEAESGDSNAWRPRRTTSARRGRLWQRHETEPERLRRQRSRCMWLGRLSGGGGLACRRTHEQPAATCGNGDMLARGDYGSEAPDRGRDGDKRPLGAGSTGLAKRRPVTWRDRTKHVPGRLTGRAGQRINTAAAERLRTGRLRQSRRPCRKDEDHSPLQSRGRCRFDFPCFPRHGLLLGAI